MSISSGLSTKREYLKMVIKYSKLRQENPKNAIKVVLEWVLDMIKLIFKVVSSRLKIAMEKPLGGLS